jgi:hypothetical protein
MKILTARSQESRSVANALSVLFLLVAGFLAWGIVEGGNVVSFLLIFVGAVVGIFLPQVWAARGATHLHYAPGAGEIRVSGTHGPELIPSDGLVVEVVDREVEKYRKSGPYKVIYQQVVLSGRPDLALSYHRTYEQARRAAVRWARLLDFPLRTRDGLLRKSGEWDLPFWKIAEQSGQVPVAAPAEGAGYAMRPKDGGVEFRSDRAMIGQEMPDLVLAAGAGLALIILFEGLPTLAEDGGVARELLLILQTILILYLVFFAAHCFRCLSRAIKPNTIHVTQEGIAYRGRRLAAEDIQEIYLVGDLQIIGSRKTIKVPDGFTSREARENWVDLLRQAVLSFCHR